MAAASTADPSGESPPSPAPASPPSGHPADPQRSDNGQPGFFTRPETLLHFTGLLSLLVVALGAAYLLPPSTVAGDFPDDDALGTPAQQTYKASRDYVIPDPEATNALREEAVAAVRPVYDLDVTAAERVRSRITLAFSTVRAAFEEDLASLSKQKRTPAEPSEEERIAIARNHRSEFIKQLQVVIDDTELRDLARTGFSRGVERATLHLAHGLLSGEIAPSRELLKAERESGITVRSVGGLRLTAERDIRDLDAIPDVATLRAELKRLAQGFGDSPSSTGRVGQLARSLSPELTPAERRAAALVAARLIQPNLAYNAHETASRKRAASQAVKPVVQQYVRGEKIIGDGERIEPRHLVVFRFIREDARALDVVRMRAGAGLFAALMVFAVHRLSRRSPRRFRPRKRDLFFLSLVLVGSLALQRGGLSLLEFFRDRVPFLGPDVTPLLLPLSAGTLLVRMLRAGGASLSFALTLVPLTLVQLHDPLPALVGLAAGLVGAERIAVGAERWALTRSAIASGLAAALTVLSLSLLNGRLLLEDTAVQMGAAVVGTALVSPLLALLFVPLFESLFGFVSRARLSRLANLNHPVLKDLIIRAPGTYHHSLLVGALAESGARAIGADALLAKVGGYYHDLGKVRAPLLFLENQKNENRLASLSLKDALEEMHGHVAHGLALARSAGLPSMVQEVIEQHHGTRPVKHLHSGARELALDSGKPPPSIDDFRYPGPRPRSPEAALVMLADAVEAAARQLPDPTPERLRELVPRVIHPILIEGELSECDLTLAEIERIIAAMQTTVLEVVRLSPVEVLPNTWQAGGKDHASRREPA